MNNLVYPMLSKIQDEIHNLGSLSHMKFIVT